MTAFEMGLALNRLGQLMDAETFARCKTTLDDIERGTLELYDRIEKYESEADDRK